DQESQWYVALDSSPQELDIDGRRARISWNKVLEFFLHSQVILDRLYARYLPDSPRRLSTGHQTRHFSAQRHHTRSGLSMDTGTTQSVVVRNLRNNPYCYPPIFVIDRLPFGRGDDLKFVLHTLDAVDAFGNTFRRLLRL